MASIMAEAMANGVVSGEAQLDPTSLPDQSEVSPSTPVVVSVSPSGTLSAAPLGAVSVSTSRAVAVPAEAPEKPEPSPDASSSEAQATATPEVEPTPNIAVPPLVTVAVPRAEPSTKETSAPQITNTLANWSAGLLKPSDPTIQPDSVLWVSVAEDPSLNGRYVVNNSSAIDFGYVGLVFLQDMSLQQAEETIRNVLEGRYLKHATVSVKMAKASYDSVGVMGNVETPGQVKIGPGATITLDDALRRAGGLRGNRESNRVKIIRGGLRSPFGPAAEGEVLSLVSPKGDLKIPEGFLRNDDLVYVFAAESPQFGGATKTTGTGKRVILLGEVPRRGVIDFGENEPCTLMYLLFKIGGLPRFAKADKIQIVRRSKNGPEKSFTVNGAALMKEGNPEDDIVLESGDRVIVPARKIAFF